MNNFTTHKVYYPTKTIHSTGLHTQHPYITDKVSEILGMWEPILLDDEEYHNMFNWEWGKVKERMASLITEIIE